MEQQHRQAGNKTKKFSKFSKFSEAITNRRRKTTRPQISPRNSVEISHGPRERAFREVLKLSFTMTRNFDKLPFIWQETSRSAFISCTRCVTWWKILVPTWGVRLQVQNMQYYMMSLEKIWVRQMGRLEAKIAAVLLYRLHSFPLACFMFSMVSAWPPVSRLAGFECAHVFMPGPESRLLFMKTNVEGRNFKGREGDYRLTFSCFEMVDPQIPILKEWD